MTSKVSHFLCRLPSGLSKRDHTIVVQCVAVALRPTNDPMHGFAGPTLRRAKKDAITQWPFSEWRNMVANRMLQIQHTTGNLLLISLNGRLKPPDLLEFSRELARQNSRALLEHFSICSAADRARLCSNGGRCSALPGSPEPASGYQPHTFRPAIQVDATPRSWFRCTKLARVPWARWPCSASTPTA